MNRDDYFQAIIVIEIKAVKQRGNIVFMRSNIKTSKSRIQYGWLHGNSIVSFTNVLLLISILLLRAVCSGVAPTRHTPTPFSQ